MEINTLYGEPTETAIVNYAIKKNKDKDSLYILMPRISEIPFDSTRKMMTTIHKIGDKYRVITKGAPDVLLKRCSKCLNKEKLEKAGLVCSGVSPDGNLVEIVELNNHPYFIAAQFHPELKSRPNRPAPLFVGLIKSAKERKM